MDLQIHGVHFSVTEAMEAYVQQQIERLKKFPYVSDAASKCRVNMSVLRKQHTAEMTIHVNGHVFHAEETCDDMYQAIESAVNKMERQIREYKNKVLKSYRHPKVTKREESDEEAALAALFD